MKLLRLKIEENSDVRKYNGEKDELYDKAVDLIKTEKKRPQVFTKKITNWI